MSLELFGHHLSRRCSLRHRYGLPRKFRETADNGAHNGAYNHSSWLFDLQSSFCYCIISTMADTLKAEGNKAFSAKDYPTAMYVATPPYRDAGMVADESPVTNSLKLSLSNPRTKSFTPTVPPSTAPRASTKKPSRMPRSPSASSRTGLRVTSVRELPTGACKIGVSEGTSVDWRMSLTSW